LPRTALSRCGHDERGFSSGSGFARALRFFWPRRPSVPPRAAREAGDRPTTCAAASIPDVLRACLLRLLRGPFLFR